MKRLFLTLLCSIILLSGCSASRDNSSDAPQNVETHQNGEEPQNSEEPEKDVLGAIENWLTEDFSFCISLQYMNLAYNGMSQEILQELAEDGSFHFITSMRQWDHNADFEYGVKAEYYYCYEDGAMVCYMRANDGQPERTVLTSAETEEILSSKSLFVGPDTLLPSYIEDFSEIGENTETGLFGCSFSLPLTEVVKSGTFLSALVQNAYALSGNEYDPESGVNILCIVEAEKETFRPVRISYDFSELKPYVLSESALSGEYALDTDLMYMIYDLDYELAETIPVPEDFL